MKLCHIMRVDPNLPFSQRIYHKTQTFDILQQTSG